MLMISADSAVLDLALVIHGARCAECVMPREHLERIALGIVERHVSGFTAVHIEDPREQPGWSPETPNPSYLGGVQ